MSNVVSLPNSQYKLTDGQRDLMVALRRFLKDPLQRAFVLTGAAGTGKSTAVRFCLNELQSSNRSFCLMAPTGRAASVLSSRSGRAASTIHSAIYGPLEPKNIFKDEYSAEASLRISEDAKDAVYFVDEASMISDQSSANARLVFGTGALLSDLCDYLDFDGFGTNRKLILIGDECQLTPIGMDDSPALNKRYLKALLGCDVASFHLSEVVRTKAGSSIIINANAMRENLLADSRTKPKFRFDSNEITVIGAGDLIKEYVAASGGRVSNSAQIITLSNRAASQYNGLVRGQLFGDVGNQLMHDKLLVTQNTMLDGTAYMNGDFVYVNKIHSDVEIRKVTLRSKKSKTGTIEVVLKFRRVSISLAPNVATDTQRTVMILENELESESSSDPLLRQALYVDFRQRHPQYQQGSSEFFGFLSRDPYFNALHVKYGYAITCHKAQGSEWPEVFVDCSAFFDPESPEYYRWLYTAITRTSVKLHLFNTEGKLTMKPKPLAARPLSTEV